MNINAILSKADIPANLSGSSIKCGNKFDIMLQQLKDETAFDEMKQFLEEKFNVDIFLTDYSCEKTDTEAQNYDLSMLERCDLTGGRNVIISKKTLLKMKDDSSFRRKVYQSIEDIPWSGKATGGCVKSNGVFIHEDGTGGYYLEFDWGDADEGTKSKKEKTAYSDNPNEMPDVMPDGQNDTGFQTEVFSSFMGADLSSMKHCTKRIQTQQRTHGIL